MPVEIIQSLQLSMSSSSKTKFVFLGFKVFAVFKVTATGGSLTWNKIMWILVH